MRNSIRRAFVAPCVALATAFVFTSSLAQDLAAQPIAGGWHSVPVQEEAVVKAARFALTEQTRQFHTPIKLLAIKHARQQVVAGNNFSMNLMVESEGHKRLIIAVVWVKPDGAMELTRWHWV